MRTFKLLRLVDHSGISGLGEIAEGVEFGDGRCVLRFKTAHRSTVVYDSMADLIAIHGHGGDTQVVYDPTHSVGRVRANDRWCLRVNGYIVAVEGQPCPDSVLGKFWTSELLGSLAKQ